MSFSPETSLVRLLLLGLALGAAACTDYYADTDGDGYGDPLAGTPILSCAGQPAGYVADNDDCDDTNSLIHPAAAELCNAVDDDCDGQLDNGHPLTTWYLDADGDGYGLTADTIDSCAQPAGYAAADGDCNDADATVYPDASELCDGLDNDCDGAIPRDELDDDVGGGDGRVACSIDAGGWDGACSPEVSAADCMLGGDCNEIERTVYPGAPELCDGRDNGCQFGCTPPADELDDDGDGYVECALADAWGGSYTVVGGGDCDDGDASIYPGAPDACGDVVDSNCDGVLDLDVDGDSYLTCAGVTPADCDDSDPTKTPVDGDGDGYSSCDGDCDDGDPAITPEDNDGDGFSVCEGDCDDNDPGLNPLDQDGQDGSSCDGDADDAHDTDGDGSVARAALPYTITVLADGSFDPPLLWIHDGDEVRWEFHDRRDAIIPVASAAGDVCLASNYKPYDDTLANEFTGPMPRIASGVFTLGAMDRKGMAVKQTPCLYSEVAQEGVDYLCAEEGPDWFSTMLETWSNPNSTGVFIRPRWNEMQSDPTTYHWGDDVEREIQAAVDHGKLFSIGIKAGGKQLKDRTNPLNDPAATPTWIFSNGVTPLDFRDSSEANCGGACGTPMTLGSPTEQTYRDLYNGMLESLATRLKTKNAWYRALAYMKPSGANYTSAENRLPKKCCCDCGVCNSSVWAQAGYTPAGLFEFYNQQTRRIADHLPGKTMAYALIHAGFPLVEESGGSFNWESCIDGTGYDTCIASGGVCPDTSTPDTSIALPSGTFQTEEILRLARTNVATGGWGHGPDFAVQHLGLGPKPVPPDPPCPFEYFHPVPDPDSAIFGWVGSGCPNKWALAEGAEGQPTGFQTNNASKLPDRQVLGSTFENLWDNSDGVYLEIYEERFWEAERHAGILDETISCRTIGDWDEWLHQRRQRDWTDPALGDPRPLEHTFTFVKTEPPGTIEYLPYVNPWRCSATGEPTHGMIAIVDDVYP